MVSAQTLVYIGFTVLPISVATVIAGAGRSKALAIWILIWMVVAAGLAQSGVLSRFNSLPPPIGLFLVSGLIGTVILSRSHWVSHLVELPLGILIGFEAFRIIVELLIHKAFAIGLAPIQMTWSGYNFDIVTAVTALLLAFWARSMPNWVVIIWNWLGLVLLTVVVGIAGVSFPTRFQLMRPDNDWVASFPYVWLPSILVPAALLGHLVIFRKLSASSSDRKLQTTPA